MIKILILTSLSVWVTASGSGANVGRSELTAATKTSTDTSFSTQIPKLITIAIEALNSYILGKGADGMKITSTTITITLPDVASVSSDVASSTLEVESLDQSETSGGSGGGGTAKVTEQQRGSQEEPNVSAGTSDRSDEKKTESIDSSSFLDSSSGDNSPPPRENRPDSEPLPTVHDTTSASLAENVNQAALDVFYLEIFQLESIILEMNTHRMIFYKHLMFLLEKVRNAKEARKLEMARALKGMDDASRDIHQCAVIMRSFENPTIIE
jgi:hypothetical protein